MARHRRLLSAEQEEILAKDRIKKIKKKLKEGKNIITIYEEIGDFKNPQSLMDFMRKHNQEFSSFGFRKTGEVSRQWQFLQS